ncbi:MAG TPA: hypothetical protein VGS22_01920 [Thermoanaerobaculia bacterium]|jgi:hypothetical protein|nr:hypothetical protein [Thermoanaerobaculia bacterium]
MKRKIQKLALRKETIHTLGTVVGGAETENRTCTLDRTCYCTLDRTCYCTQDRTCTCTSETIC